MADKWMMEEQGRGREETLTILRQGQTCVAVDREREARVLRYGTGKSVCTYIDCTSTSDVMLRRRMDPYFPACSLILSLEWEKSLAAHKYSSRRFRFHYQPWGSHARYELFCLLC